MKRILAIIFFTILFSNSVMSEEINKTYSCAEEGWLTEKLKIYNSFDHLNGKLLVDYASSLKRGRIKEKLTKMKDGKNKG